MEEAHVGPEDIDVCELHDCFSANELITYEALGFAAEGEGHKLVEEEATTYGGKVVVVPYFVSRSPEAFYQLLNDEGVTVLNQTPSAFRQLIEVDEREAAALSLRLVRVA